MISPCSNCNVSPLVCQTASGWYVWCVGCGMRTRKFATAEIARREWSNGVTVSPEVLAYESTMMPDDSDGASLQSRDHWENVSHSRNKPRK